MVNYSVMEGDSVIQCNDNIQPGESNVKGKHSPVSGKVLRSRVNLRNVTKVFAENVCNRGEENVEIKRRRPRGPKKAKDATAPRKPGSPFILFGKGERANVMKELNICNGGPVMIKELGRRWDKLDEKVKEVYKKRAAADRMRYNQEMLGYKPSLEFLRKKAEFKRKRKYHLEAQGHQLRTRGRAKGAAFMIYCKDERPIVLKELKNCSDSYVSKVLAQRWDGLDLEVRETYKERAKEECKKDYNKLTEDSMYNKEFCSNNSESNRKRKYGLQAKGVFYKQYNKSTETTDYFLYMLSNWMAVSCANPEYDGSQVQSQLWKKWLRMKEEKTCHQSREKEPINSGLWKYGEREPRIKKVCVGLSRCRLEDLVGMSTNMNMKSNKDKLYRANRKIVLPVSGDMNGEISEAGDITQDSDENILGMEDDTNVFGSSWRDILCDL